ncbi:MAG: 30S ribosomal protein S14 [Candidatus Anstonellales archaeon]
MEEKKIEIEHLKALTSKKRKGIRKCKRCSTAKGLIRKYGIYLCRRCFRELGESMGFRKLR